MLRIAAPDWLFAQSLEAGTRIRVTAPRLLPPNQVGRLVSLDADALVMQYAPRTRKSAGLGAAQWVIPRGAIQRLEASTGTRGHAALGFGIGVGIGLVSGLIAVKGDRACSGGSSDAFCGSAVAVFTVGGGLLGTLVGAIVHTDMWERIELSGLATPDL